MRHDLPSSFQLNSSSHQTEKLIQKAFASQVSHGSDYAQNHVRYRATDVRLNGLRTSMSEGTHVGVATKHQNTSRYPPLNFSPRLDHLVGLSDIVSSKLEIIFRLTVRISQDHVHCAWKKKSGSIRITLNYYIKVGFSTFVSFHFKNIFLKENRMKITRHRKCC